MSLWLAPILLPASVAGVWYLAAEELPVPPWVAATLALAVWFASVHVWPGGILAAVLVQVAVFGTWAVVRTVRAN